MEDLICLDTGAAVDILRKTESALQWLNSLSPETVVSTTLITLFELYHGVYLGSRIKQELEDIKDMLEYTAVLPLTANHMQVAAQESVALQRKGKTIDLRDLLIGVCTREEGFTLKTRNPKHFADIERLEISD